jgi:3-hydroxybutyryl-CoA dehydrogenase
MAAGPFGIMDRIGLETIYNVTSHWAEVKRDEQLRRNAAYVKTRFLDRGRLGVKTGEGFYTYPEPAFRKPGFLSE